jgi:hypothetical protein
MLDKLSSYQEHQESLLGKSLRKKITDSLPSNIQAQIKMNFGYLKIMIKESSYKKQTLKTLRVEKEDLHVMFWGDESVHSVMNLIGFLPSEKVSLVEGDVLEKSVPTMSLAEWIKNNKQIRLRRRKSINSIEKLLSELFDLSYEKIIKSKKTCKIKDSDIISFMDGSARLWLEVISSAKKDFLKGCEDPRRIEEWESLNPFDLLDESGNVKRGAEEAWTYVTARDFIFDDNYKINIGDPKDNKTVNYEDLLEYLIEVCQGRSIDASVLDPSIKQARREIARKSGDPKLIAIYC